MEEITAGLLFNDTMVMIAGGSGSVGGGGGGVVNGSVVGEVEQFSSPSPPYSYEQSNASSRSSTSSCSPTYYANQLPPELFTEFNEFSAFELNSGGGGGGSEASGFLNNGSSDEERNYMEELISSDLSSDEDKFLETIRYGGGGGVVHFTNDLLSEEELVNTIQGYGDVKVVQVDGGSGGGGVEDVGECVDSTRVFEVVREEDGGGGKFVKVERGKKRKGSVGGKGGGGGGVKRTLIIQQTSQQAPPQQKKHHKPTQKPRVFQDEDIVIETSNGDETITGDIADSPSPGSPQQQVDSNGQYQELKLSDEEKRLLMKEGISLPTHYPLTKLEERELKRIRRKIRNKISAQDSRKRKKEFLDRLQQKLQEVEDEKSLLQKRVRSLESINTKLNAQVKRLQQALASGVTSVQNSVQQQQKQNVVPAATTLLVLILSLALVVLPTSLEGGGKNTGEHANEIISLLNRSNEMSGGGGRVMSGGGERKLGVPRSRTMVGEGDEEMDDEDMVRELIGEMKVLLRGKRKRNEVVGMVKRGRFDTGGGGSTGLSGLLGGLVRKESKSGGWWVSDEEDEDGGNSVGGRKVGLGRFGERKHAFQVIEDVEVD